MPQRDTLEALKNHFSLDQLLLFLRSASDQFRPIKQDFRDLISNDPAITELFQIGRITHNDFDLIVVVGHYTTDLSSRTGRRTQFQYAKQILDRVHVGAGIFVFADDQGRFRFSLVVTKFMGLRRDFTSYRRFTYFVDPQLPNKTFINQVGKAKFTSVENLLRAFSIEAVSDEFYNEFYPNFRQLAETVQGTDNVSLKEDFALLFVIRIIFLGFVQKKKWLGNNETFLQSFSQEYRANRGNNDTFYREWLKPLFFEALNNPPGHPVAYGIAPFSTSFQDALNNSPYLNGELFKSKSGVDDRGLWLTDVQIFAFFDFLFQYNFTVEENRQYDEELELNPEFLGIIFERIVNKADGAVYTPRTEVDLMCRLGLVKWLQENTISGITPEKLYRFFFHQRANGDQENELEPSVTFTSEQVTELLSLLQQVTVCDPAAGSGAFEVGMLHVLTEALETLYENELIPASLKEKKPSDFELKKAIIANSLYGVEVKRWAVWINQLRLWLTLFVDMPDDMKNSQNPLLPNLTFKVRVGDSLVQRVGTRRFPVQGSGNIPTGIRNQLNRLMQIKREYFNNHSIPYEQIENEELRVFSAILDQEIDAKRIHVVQLRAPQYQQETLIPSERQLNINLTAANLQQIDQLETEIQMLLDQKNCLREKRPFLWSLEFSEVFFNKGGFDIIIGNPPYVRNEDIADPNAGLNAQDYKGELKQMLLLDFPQYFQRSVREPDQFRNDRRPDGHSDLYTYFYIRSLRLLNPKGIHIFICSNSWLDVGFGAWLQEFLLHKIPIFMVIDNHARRSFTRSDINTIITVLGASRAQVTQDFKAKFIAFKKPFEESISSDAFLTIENSTQIFKDEDLRIYPISVSELFQEGSQASGEDGTGPVRYVGNKWGGIYLRAPDIYFTILEKGRGKLVRLGDVAHIRRGITTGANDFFYLRPLGQGSRPGLVRVRNDAGWEGDIEEGFIKPALRTTRECQSYKVNPNGLTYSMFICPETRLNLRKTKALEYIIWGENQGYHERPSCRNRTTWWSLPEQLTPQFIITRFRNLRNWFPIITDDLKVGDTVFVGNINNNLPVKNSLLSLNSTLTLLITEILGRSNLGEGLLTTYGPEISRFLFVDPALLDFSSFNFETFYQRIVRNIYEECGYETENISFDQEPNPLIDRSQIDNVVFNSINLSSEEQKQVYKTYCEIVNNRLNRANVG